MSVLEVNDLTVEYQTKRGPVRAVNGVDLKILPGQLLAVVGETGSGKSTAALAAIGLLPESARRIRGTIHVGGRDITDWNRRRLRSLHGTEIGLVPQDPTASLDPLKTIGWQVGEALRLHRRSTDIEGQVTQLLERVGITDPYRVARSYPHQLSGGQRQRALIAGAIALRPSLLIADESTSALDVTVQRRVLDLFDELRREEGTGILLVTHDLSVAAERADHIVVLQHGTVQDAGPAHEILGGGTSEYTRRLVSNAPALRPVTFRLNSLPPRLPEAADSEVRETRERPVITIHDLTKRFGSGALAVTAVQRVSLEVAAGTTHAIVGESGSGKSTIARLVMGLETATSGQVIVDGVDTATLDSRVPRRDFRRNVQLVYQSPYASLTPSLSILDTVAEPLRRFGLASARDSRKRAAELLDRMSIPGQLHDRRPRELSGGQRQRVAIARALAPEPRIVVLDEPVSALDVSVQAQILDLLDELQRERNLSYLFISHDLSVVRQISDAVTVLHDGRVEETGPTRDIFTSPQCSYTQELLAAAPHVDPALIQR